MEHRAGKNGLSFTMHAAGSDLWDLSRLKTYCVNISTKVDILSTKIDTPYGPNYICLTSFRRRNLKLPSIGKSYASPSEVVSSQPAQ